MIRTTLPNRYKLKGINILIGLFLGMATVWGGLPDVKAEPLKTPADTEYKIGEDYVRDIKVINDLAPRIFNIFTGLEHTTTEELAGIITALNAFSGPYYHSHHEIVSSIEYSVRKINLISETLKQIPTFKMPLLAEEALPENTSFEQMVDTHDELLAKSVAKEIEDAEQLLAAALEYVKNYQKPVAPADNADVAAIALATQKAKAYNKELINILIVFSKYGLYNDTRLKIIDTPFTEAAGTLRFSLGWIMMGRPKIAIQVQKILFEYGKKLGLIPPDMELPEIPEV